MKPLPAQTDGCLRRLDHLICETDDIEGAMRLFVDRLGFPEAWPVGRFWPQGRTSGVALGGINLEFLQADENPPTEARIRTLVFEPTEIERADLYYREAGRPMRLFDKMEENSDLLRLRGFDEAEARIPQRICLNLIPEAPAPVDFFLCRYVPMLRERLGPKAFPGLPRVQRIVVASPESHEWTSLFPWTGEGPEIAFVTGETAEVVEIQTERGPIDLGDWPARFRFA